MNDLELSCEGFPIDLVLRRHMPLHLLKVEIVVFSSLVPQFKFTKGVVDNYLIV
jgi:hypothetical protein